MNDDFTAIFPFEDGKIVHEKRLRTVLKQDFSIATGDGHHSMLNSPGTDDWYILYHRTPIPTKSMHYRVVSIDYIYYNADGSIQHVKMTNAGVEKQENKILYLQLC